MLRTRQKIERQIVKKTIGELLAAGYGLGVADPDDDEWLIENSTDADAVMKELMAADEEHLYVYRDGKRIGWVYFVYGNSGWDVISDYTVNLEPVMKIVGELEDELEKKYA